MKNYYSKKRWKKVIGHRIVIERVENMSDTDNTRGGIKRWMEKYKILFEYLLAISTLFLALFAVCSWKTTSNYYSKTTRPYINVRLEEDPEVNADSTFVIKYILENHGTIPAKYVQSVAKIFTDNKEKSFHNFDLSDVFNSIYPNGRITMDSGKLHLFSGAEQYLHIIVIYTDIDELKNYFTDAIFLYHPIKQGFMRDKSYIN